MVAAVAAAALLAPAGAAAHGGATVIGERDGGYDVTLQAADSPPGADPEVDLTAYLVQRRTGAPDLDADVTVVVDRGGEREAHDARVVGGGYEAIVPEGERGDWRRWGFEVRVAGAAGRARVATGPVAERAEQAMPGWAIPSAAALALLALAAVLLRRSSTALRRR